MTAMKQTILFLCALFMGVTLMAQEAPYVEGELIVQISKQRSIDQVVARYQHLKDINTGLEVRAELSDDSKIYLLSFDNAAISDNDVRGLLGKDRDVLAVQFNHIIQMRQAPNDPGYGSQWFHNNIDSELAWDITTGGTTANGDEIVVAVIEDANYPHNDLIDNHWVNTAEIDGNGIDDDGNGYVDDYHGWNPGGNNDNVCCGGHGTAVNGMVGGKGNNGIGGAGVNWDVQIMNIQIGSLNEASVISSYEYAYDMRNLYNTTNGAEGAFVVATNASWGIDGANPANYPVWCAYYDTLGSVGILNCGATANNNVNIDSVGDMPTGCSSDYMVAVTATNVNDQRTFSGYGQTTIDLGAPGESVSLPSGSSGYSNTSGTSFASPCVAGAIALMYSAPCPDLAALALTNPQQAADMVRGYIFDGVDPVAQLATETVTGGRLNLKNSLDLALGNCGPLPPCNPVSLSLTTECTYNELTQAAEASITVDVQMSENFCSAVSVCYAAQGQSPICDDLASLGVNLDNNSTYTINGLQSNTTYDVYFTTADGTSATQSITTGNCDALVPGCTDVNATNYDPAATFDDGSCVFPCSTVTLTIDTDCWGGEVSWEVLDASGNVVASVGGGTYGNQQTFTWSECLEWGCYTFNIFDSFGDGMAGTIYGCAVNGNYTMSDDQGNVLFAMGDPNYGSSATHSFCLPVDQPGCTDPTACNFNPAATTDDGSCEFTSCAGCTNASACNYDPTATLDDGSCQLPDGCTDSTACNYNAGATCDDGSCEYTSCAGCTNASACNYDPTATLDDGSCQLPDGCTDSTACNYNAGATCDDGSCEYTSCAGCTNASACNYDPTATLDDGSCQLPDGCTDSTACNYNPAATCDDGSCEFTSCVSCEGDFNQDGMRDVGDFLNVLATFGCTSDCGETDMTGDGMVTSSDVLYFLGLIGEPCP
jgi:hypothetical protein